MPSAATTPYGLLGHPVGHSLSPVMHNAAFAACGIDAVYLAFDVAPADLGAAIEGARALGVRGLNVTVPHKVAAAQHCTRLADEARRIGAVNTIVFEGAGVVGRNTDGARSFSATAHAADERGGIVGHNTDGQGFLLALRSELGCDGQGVRALVLGAGGSARAVCAALAMAGAREIAVAARDPGRARELVDGIAGMAREAGVAGAPLGGTTGAEEDRARNGRSAEDAAGAPDSHRTPSGKREAHTRVVPWNEGSVREALGAADLVVSCLPPGADVPGLTATADGPAARPSGLLPGTLVFDLVYGRDTAILAAARQAGARAADGLEMLVRQGALSFELWTGREAPLHVMRAAAREKLARRRAAT